MYILRSRTLVGFESDDYTYCSNEIYPYIFGSLTETKKYVNRFIKYIYGFNRQEYVVNHADPNEYGVINDYEYGEDVIVAEMIWLENVNEYRTSILLTKIHGVKAKPNLTTKPNYPARRVSHEENVKNLKEHPPVEEPDDDMGFGLFD